MHKRSINPKSLFNSVQYGFSQIVECQPRKMVFISGQVAWDKHGQMVGGNDLEKQTRKAMDNLKVAMKEVGGRLENIVMLRIYIVNLQQEEGAIISRVLKENFRNSPPASTWLNVQGLANEDFRIEIEAQAVL